MATVQPANAIGTLVVRLYRADKLQDKDLTGLQNPFATLVLEPLGSQKQESNVVKDGSINPVFDQRFVFKLEGKESVLDLHIYHKGVLTRSIGSVKIPIETLIQAPDLSWYALDQDRGMVMLQSQFRGAMKGVSIDTFDDGTISFFQALLFPPVTTTLEAEPLGPGMAVATANPPTVSAVGGIVYESLSSCPMLDAVGTMVIEIVRCENLKDMNWTASDQSVFFFLQLEPMRSQNHMGDVLRHVGTEGMVDQRYKFILDGRENVLNLFVYKRGGILNRRIGKVHLPLALLLKSDQPQWFALESGTGLIQMRSYFRGALNGQQLDTFDVSVQSAFEDLPLPTSLPPYIPFAATDADRVPPSARAVGQLVLHLQRAEDLVDKTWTGSHQNPYAKLQFNTNTANAIRTRAIQDGGKAPEFDERFVFELNGNESQLEVFIYHYSDFIDREIGRAYIPVEQLLSCFIPTWFPLNNENGRVLLTAQFKGTFRDQLFDSYDENTVQFLMNHAQAQLSQAIPPAAIGTDIVGVDEKANAATLPVTTSSVAASSQSAVGAAMQAPEEPLPAAAVGELVLHAIRARNLKDKTWTGGDQNPYVVISLSPSKQRSQGSVVQKGGTDPTFDQKLLFVLEGAEIWLDVTIMHRSPFIDRKIAHARLHLDHLLSLDTPRWIELDGGRGDIELSAQFRGTVRGTPLNTFDPETVNVIPGLTHDWNELAAAGWIEQTRDLPFAEANGVMVLHVVKAEHLKDKDWSGNEQFPYITVWIEPYELQRQKSPPIKFGGINPTFDQRFLMRLAGSETSVKVQLFHQAVLADRRIGTITLPVDELLMHAQPQWFYLDDDGGAIQVAARFRGTVRGRTVDTLAPSDLEAFPALQASSPGPSPSATATAVSARPASEESSSLQAAAAAPSQEIVSSDAPSGSRFGGNAVESTEPSEVTSSDASTLVTPPGAPPAAQRTTQTLGVSETPREMVFDGGEISGTRTASSSSLLK